MVDRRRLDLRGVTPQPPAATPGERGNGGKLDDDELRWLRPPDEARAARRRTALMVLAVVAVIAGLVVVAVIVSLVAYRRLQR
jgi:heme/copper-type cytochrome/quinol oxidase subunit 2